MPDLELNSAQHEMLKIWTKHLDAEFRHQDATLSCGTMTPDATVNHVPVMTGGSGVKQLEHFYGRYFIPQMPADVTMVPVARTIGTDRIVDEFVFCCTHSVRMDWMAPGIEATGRRIEIPMVVAVDFRGGRIAAERIYWDQAGVLVQLGLIDPSGLPVTSGEAAAKVLDPTKPSNALIKRSVDDSAI
jgi:carboxymethylenebutenolidase